ncbi:MAG: preprotein translocase subunit SecE [Berryella intestinalis]|uniref:preprotein translocase subunit SecE n=1 Tax=Berryella intestinalis TaxID=1531429 RepID=UPI002A75AB37|nr:preprotein translocase subunit SecE [Berryella intestinalis]MDY3129058.1 preprotein translocase subunit SecE [Berryella intestinalis]
MAHKSKTQRAKASAARSAKKAERAEQSSVASSEPVVAAESTEAPKKGLFAKSEKKEAAAAQDKQPKAKKVEKETPKKSRFAFFKDVKAELKRVTWPSRQDVVQWSLVVVAALLFFGLYVGLLDNVIITPLLVAISGLGA